MAYNKKAHLRDNIEAIRLMFRLEKEQRTATPEEAGILAAYSGFGGIKAVLSPFGKLTDILRWTQADRELFPLITELHNVLRDGAADEREYRRLVESVKASTFTAFYTPPAIVNAIASSLGEHGVSPGRFLDPSSGTGNFVSAFRSQCHSASGNTPEIVAYEKDLLTGRILARLHPEAQVNIKGFEELPPHRNGYFDVVSSNIPFGDIRVFDPSFDNGTARRFALNSLHNYFFAKGLDAVREGGVLAFITSQGVMNSAMAYPVRQYLMNRSRLLSAVRLPNNLFTDYAGTEVGSDLIILQKDTLSQREYTSLERSFVEVGTQTDGTTQNEYFEHTAAIVHTRGHVGTDPYGKPARIYLHDGGMEAIAADMKYFLDRNLSEQLDLDLYLRHSPVQEFRNLVSRPAETMQQRIAQVREINRSGNMNGHSTSTDRQTIQVERRTSTPEQPSTGCPANRRKDHAGAGHVPVRPFRLHTRGAFTGQEKENKEHEEGLRAVVPFRYATVGATSRPGRTDSPRERAAGAGTAGTGTPPAGGRGRTAGTHEAPSLSGRPAWTPPQRLPCGR